jgi:hypothetical protein
MTRVVVWSTRHYGDDGRVLLVLGRLDASRRGPVDVVVYPAGSGAGRAGAEWARGRGRLASAVRSGVGVRAQVLLDVGRPALVLAFGDLDDEGRDLLRRAEVMSVDVERY